jgi:TetR/AcrR family transcriptional regulator, cholesterol catabolism regulator
MANKKSTPKRYAEILDAAAAIFAEKGYHGASTTDIADRLGIQQAGVYYYFKSKDSVLAEVCRLGVQGYLEHLSAISKSDAPSDVKIRLAIREHLLPFHHFPDYVKVFHSERRYLTGENQKQVQKLANKYERELRRLFENGVAAGDFRKNLNCKLVTLGLLGMCNSVATWYDGKTEKYINDIAEIYADNIIGGVKI